METSVQCYLVRVMVVPDLLGRHWTETYFLAKSDHDAVKDSFQHALSMISVYNLRVTKIEVFEYHLSTMVEGVSQGGVDRLLYDSENLSDSIIKERPDFIG